MGSQLSSLSLVSKIVLILSLLLFFIWVVPIMLQYYKSVDDLDIKQQELQPLYTKFNMNTASKPFTVKAFKEETKTLFLIKKVEKAPDLNEYHCIVEVDKSKLNNFNTFVETLSLQYLVKIKNSELSFKEKGQNLEVEFTLQSL